MTSERAKITPFPISITSMFNCFSVMAKNSTRGISLEYYDANELIAEIVYSAEHDLIDKEELSQREQIVKKALGELSPKQREILFYF